MHTSAGVFPGASLSWGLQVSPLGQERPQHTPDSGASFHLHLFCYESAFMKLGRVHWKEKKPGFLA